MRLEEFLLNESINNFYLTDGNDRCEKAVIFTSGKNKDNATNTVKSFTKIFDKMGIEYYIAFAEDAYITRDKKGDNILRIFNVDDNEGFVINSKNTLIINRAAVAYQRSSLDLVSQLEKNHFFCVNSRSCLEICGDKFRTGTKLMELGISTPRTLMVRSEEGLEHAFKSVGGKFPVVLKTITGTQGKGVFISESWKNMKSTLQTIWQLNPETEILVQEYIKSSGDLRIHVLNDEIIAAMKRIHGKEEFRANYHLGGDIEKIKIEELNPEIKDLSIKAAKAVGGIWTGVDVIISEKTGKPYVLEVNTSPGTEGIEKASGINVTKIVANYITNKANWRMPTTTCGYIENIWVDGIGFMTAKFDTGNGALCAMHADEYEIKGDKIFWKCRGKKFKNDLVDMKKIKIGGLKSFSYEERPVITMTVKFNGETFENIQFCLTNRMENTKKHKSELLINRKFMRLAGLNVDPNTEYLLSLKNPEEKNSKMNA